MKVPTPRESESSASEGAETDSPDEAARNNLETDIALRDAEKALKAPDHLVAAAASGSFPTIAEPSL